MNRSLHVSRCVIGWRTSRRWLRLLCWWEELTKVQKWVSECWMCYYCRSIKALGCSSTSILSLQHRLCIISGPFASTSAHRTERQPKYLNMDDAMLFWCRLVNPVQADSVASEQLAAAPLLTFGVFVRWCMCVCVFKHACVCVCLETYCKMLLRSFYASWPNFELINLKNDPDQNPGTPFFFFAGSLCHQEIFWTLYYNVVCPRHIMRGRLGVGGWKHPPSALV